MAEYRKYQFSQNEHGIQSAFFNWVRKNRKHSPNEDVRNALSLCYAVPNGLSTNQSQRAYMEGLTKGIPDINLDWATFPCEASAPFLLIIKLIDKLRKLIGRNVYSFCGLRIEMKFGKNTLTKEQKEKKALLEKAGYKWVTCKTVKEAIKAVVEYLPFLDEDYIEPEYT